MHGVLLRMNNDNFEQALEQVIFPDLERGRIGWDLEHTRGGGALGEGDL